MKQFLLCCAVVAAVFASGWSNSSDAQWRRGVYVSVGVPAYGYGGLGYGYGYRGIGWGYPAYYGGYYPSHYGYSGYGYGYPSYGYSVGYAPVYYGGYGGYGGYGCGW